MQYNGISPTKANTAELGISFYQPIKSKKVENNVVGLVFPVLKRVPYFALQVDYCPYLVDVPK